MSLAKDNIWKLLAPLVVMGVMFLIPVPTVCRRRHGITSLCLWQ